jgi:hypothetical protein
VVKKEKVDPVFDHEINVPAKVSKYHGMMIQRIILKPNSKFGRFGLKNSNTQKLNLKTILSSETKKKKRV